MIIVLISLVFFHCRRCWTFSCIGANYHFSIMEPMSTPPYSLSVQSPKEAHLFRQYAYNQSENGSSLSVFPPSSTAVNSIRSISPNKLQQEPSEWLQERQRHSRKYRFLLGVSGVIVLCLLIGSIAYWIISSLTTTHLPYSTEYSQSIPTKSTPANLSL
ncbi:uncharacterized protein BYT42DRAFT_643855 [Radiomyces spectabilis]|uniref:uncharacterized protein n=1 Tax=Radiomyces spectabilis TaxID=64574 RepID=UPI00221F1B90|nr:uncharacterized protein BYT42DRAFT_643855 [Radiomyces spectabilis]KAI8380978.1 hypothetical protein BYT42DRAFT_643855 [Radiomyces spectabilis]